MARFSYEQLPCPFCKDGLINCMYVPSVWGEKRGGRTSLGSGKRITKSREQWIIQSGCSKCGKSQEEVEKELRAKEMI